MHHPLFQKFILGYGDSGGGINPLAAFIAPLAGLALLGAAAAVSINPVLVQLAVVNGGRRKKRSNSNFDHQKKVTEIQLLENFLARETDFSHQTENMVAQYLQCSGLSTDQNQCLERLVCIYAANGMEKEASKQEREVISM